MKDILKESYMDWLLTKVKHGKVDEVLDRLDKRNRMHLIKNIVETVASTREIEKDRDFMERVGDEILKRQKRIESGEEF